METKDEHLALLDLALGELSPEAEAELRLRLAERPDLREELAALEQGLGLAARIPVETPSRAMDDVLMAAARRHAAPAPVAERGWARVVEFLRETINGPQAAMATITVLLVAVGLWFIPTDGREAEEQAAMRISDAHRPPPEEGTPLLAPAAPEPEPDQTASGGILKIELEEAKELDKTRAEARRAPAKRATKAGSSVRERSAAPSELAEPPLAKRSAPAPSASGAALSDEYANEAKFEAAPARGGSATRAAPSRAPAPAPESAAAPSFAEEHEEEAPIFRLAEAERLFRAGSHAAAASLAREIIAHPTPVETRSLATAYDVAARSERALGRHAAAVPLYRKLLSLYPSYPRRAAAAAELQDSLSRL